MVLLLLSTMDQASQAVLISQLFAHEEVATLRVIWNKLSVIAWRVTAQDNKVGHIV